MTISATSSGFACGFSVATDLGTQITTSFWNSTSALISPHAELSECSGTVETESIIPRSFVQHAALTPDLSLSNTTHGGARHARGLIQTVFKCGKRTCFPFMYLIFNECNEWSFLDSNYNIVWRRVAWSLTRPMGRAGPVESGQKI